jgi:hypothetical protein
VKVTESPMFLTVSWVLKMVFKQSWAVEKILILCLIFNLSQKTARNCRIIYLNNYLKNSQFILSSNIIIKPHLSVQDRLLFLDIIKELLLDLAMRKPGQLNSSFETSLNLLYLVFLTVEITVLCRCVTTPSLFFRTPSVL